LQMMHQRRLQLNGLIRPAALRLTGNHSLCSPRMANYWTFASDSYFAGLSVRGRFARRKS
jgi:hypothetical protein